MTQSAEIIFYPMKARGIVPKGITILEAARRLGVHLEGPCGGMGKCGKDMIQVRVNKNLDTVLACKTHVEGDMEVTIPSLDRKDMKIVEGFYAEGGVKYDVNPSVRKEGVLNEQGLCRTRVYINEKLSSIEEGETQSHLYGIALDIGTTTLVAALVDLNNGKILGSSSALNPLVSYGHDVMSRIKYSTSNKDGLLRMHRELIFTVNFLIHFLSSERAVKPENIYEIIAAGNTTMQHIFLNKEIKGIGEYPYKMEISDTFTTTAKELAINSAQYAPVTTLPCISGYVGGDIVSGLLAINRNTLELPALFLDIGTNGEMVLILDDKMIATSTAAGPCFEGMTISSGMRAGDGAIEHVSLEDEVTLEVIGNIQPRGICGSGLLDIVSELLRVGLVNSRGRLQPKEGNEIPEKYKKYLFEKNGKRYFQLANEVALSQEDIRQVQLAKAAIRAGVEILLTNSNIKHDELNTVVIAGAFGYHLKEESLFKTGFLPGLKKARLLYIGNSSLEGAVRTLLNKELISESGSIAKTTQVLELSQIPEFEGVFMREMHFR
ncbi:MAG: ASKHA domain-containing protein [Candidatus Brocadiaceae bacterium]